MLMELLNLSVVVALNVYKSVRILGLFVLFLKLKTM
ncbi:MAG: hypothetical protein [Chaetfec virus UA24_2285]|nr:MAG: hypothetical protein [Chaetfec virus UA24_2285]